MVLVLKKLDVLVLKAYETQIYLFQSTGLCSSIIYFEGLILTDAFNYPKFNNLDPQGYICIVLDFFPSFLCKSRLY